MRAAAWGRAQGTAEAASLFERWNGAKRTMHERDAQPGAGGERARKGKTKVDGECV